MNELRNLNVKYEILHNLDIEQKIWNMNNKTTTMNVRDQLLKIKDKTQQLFVGVEQGSRKNCDNVFALFHLSMRKKVMQWIKNEYGKKCKKSQKKS